MSRCYNSRPNKLHLNFSYLCAVLPRQTIRHILKEEKFSRSHSECSQSTYGRGMEFQLEWKVNWQYWYFKKSRWSISHVSPELDLWTSLLTVPLFGGSLFIRHPWNCLLWLRFFVAFLTLCRTSLYDVTNASFHATWSVIVTASLTHWGRVKQICIFTLQLCKTDDEKSAFLTRACFPCTIHLIMQYIEPVSEWSCLRMFVETWPHSELNFRHRASSI